MTTTTTTTSCASKTFILFLVFNIILALASHAEAARTTPTTTNNNATNDDKKKPDCIVDPDGSVLFPGLGRIYVPLPGSVQYDPPAAGSSGLSGDGTSPIPGGERK